MLVAVYAINYQGWGARSKNAVISRYMPEGIRKNGDEVILRDRFNGVEADVALAYGWIHEIKDKIFSSYLKAGKHFVFFDVGYWDRHKFGNYRFAVDDWDTNTNMAKQMPGDRAEPITSSMTREWNQSSKDIIIAAMSKKAASTHGYRYLEWEERIKEQIVDCLKDKDFNIYIRTKPRPGDVSQPIEHALKKARFVVTHHSNVAVDCLRMNIPYYCTKGVGRRLSQPLTSWAIQYPVPMVLQSRIELLNDISYAQWNAADMKSGAAWKHIRGVLCGLDTTLR